MRQRGFTLLEIMVAFLVLAIVFTMVMQLITGGLQNARRSANFTEAALLANSKMAEIGTLILIEEGSDQGSFNDRFDWQLEILLEPIETTGGLSPDSYPLELYRINLTVTWRDGNARADYTTLRAVSRDI